jgi:uncharacterized protein (DUF302 family)
VRRSTQAAFDPTSRLGGAPSPKPPRGGADDEIIVTKVSPWSMADTVARLSGVVAARGLKVFAVIDHSDEARRVGLALRDTRLFIVGSPKVTTSVIEAAPLAVIDLPLRGRLPNGRSTTPSPAEVARRYGLDADLAGALESIDTWTGAVVNR